MVTFVITKNDEEMELVMVDEGDSALARRAADAYAEKVWNASVTYAWEGGVAGYIGWALPGPIIKYQEAEDFVIKK